MKTGMIPGTEMEVSRICLGTMTFGTPVGEREAIGLVHYAMDQGINYIDTANMYEGYARVPGSSGGVAEEILGKALKGRRNKAVVATKLGMKVGNAPEDEFTSPAAIRKQLEESLRRLDTDCIDIYYLHKYDPHTSPEEIIHALDLEIKKGRIRAYGVSNYTVQQMEKLIHTARRNNMTSPVICQPKLNLLNRESLSGILPLCVKEKLAVTPYQILEGGLLTGKYKRGMPVPPGSRKSEKPDWVDDMSGETYDRLEEFERNAAAMGLTMTQYAIRWVLEQEGVVASLIGVKNRGQIDEAVAAAAGTGS